MVQVCVECEEFLTGGFVFQYGPGCYTWTSGIPPLGAYVLGVFAQGEITIVDELEAVGLVEQRTLPITPLS